MIGKEYIYLLFRSVPVQVEADLTIRNSTAADCKVGCNEL